MKLKHFTGKDVFGYLQFEIDFHPNISFLVGVNGSGKTTVLRLIQALLTPSLRDLTLIPYQEISILIEDKGRDHQIRCRKTSGELELSTTATSGTLTLAAISQEDVEVSLSREGRSSDIFDELQAKYSSNEVFKLISSLNAPLILGLERTHRSATEATREAMILERERIYTANTHRGLNTRRMMRGSLAAGLMETQMLVQEAYRRMRQIEDRQSERLRESILLSAFKYYDFTSLTEEQGTLFPNWMEQRKILGRKAEIDSALRKIGLSKEKITNMLETFFQRLEDLFASMQPEDLSGFPIEFVINKAQIDRVSDLIEVIDTHKSEVDKLFAPVHKFLVSINSFYADTRKSISIDAVGQLSVMRPDKTAAPVEALSSGERQLLIIFAHLIFNEFGNRSNVFIIDEPELSLHLKWQERFVAEATNVNPKTQLILATHSPEIVAGYEKHSITL